MILVDKGQFDRALAARTGGSDFRLTGPGASVEGPEDRFEQARLPGSVRAVDPHQTGRQFQVERREDAEVPQRERRDLH